MELRDSFICSTLRNLSKLLKNKWRSRQNPSKGKPGILVSIKVGDGKKAFYFIHVKAHTGEG